MKKMKTVIEAREIRTSILAVVTLAILTGGLYPLTVWTIAQVVFPHQANGSLIRREGKIAGSRLIAQDFTGPQYFHPRPSSCGYDGARSGGSNLGPLSQKLVDRVKESVAQYRRENNLPENILIPPDAVCASASGLDPHISVKNAKLQAARIARTRNLTRDEVMRLVGECTAGPAIGFLGEPGVNVLRLNLALDDLSVKSHAP